VHHLAFDLIDAPSAALLAAFALIILYIIWKCIRGG
jgi:hypothetical protein